MIYKNIKEGIFLSRPNRFIANVLIDNEVSVCHVKNTGRCKELLMPNTKVYVNKSDNINRKTKYDLIAVEKGNLLINMDSYAPNIAFGEWLSANKEKYNLTKIKSEYTYGDSRFDFYAETDEEKILIEIKGVTLEKDGVVLFPDAPSLRAVKHINGLIEAKKQGYVVAIVFIIQMEKAKYFTPNYETHKEFGEALQNAEKNGVIVKAFSCDVTTNSISIKDEVKIIL